MVFVPIEALFANVRSIVNTGKRQGLSAFLSIKNVLSPFNSLFC